MRPARIAAFAAALCLGAAVYAHDSWLSPARETASAGSLSLELTTGTRFPRPEFSQTSESVAQAHCRDGAGAVSALTPGTQQAQWLEMHAPSPSPTLPLACWLELRPASIELAAPIVQVYFNEIHAAPAARQAWSDMQARKVPWRESYRKFARIELAQSSPVSKEQLAQARRPVGLALEIVVLGDDTIAPAVPLAFQVLRDGAPLAGFEVELVSERSPLGIWRRTDANGIVRHQLPFGGRWLLRGTDLRLSVAQADSWDSRFVTLAIDAR
jgi:hypothetical protein